MAAAAYRHLARQLELPDLLMQADFVRETMATPGWKFLVDSIAEHEAKMLAQVLNETTKPDDLQRLRGLVQGLKSMQEAADSILELAADRLDEAQRKSAKSAGATA